MTTQPVAGQTLTPMNESTAVASARVLVVDDERPLAGMVAAYLSRAGYETAVAHTGPEALEAVRSRARSELTDLL